MRKTILITLVLLLLIPIQASAVTIEVLENIPIPEPRIVPIKDDKTDELIEIRYFVQSTGAVTGTRYRTPMIYITAENKDGTTATVSIPADFPSPPAGETRVYRITITKEDMVNAGFKPETFRDISRISIGADLEVYNASTGTVLIKIYNDDISVVYPKLELLQAMFGFNEGHIEDMKSYWVGSLLRSPQAYMMGLGYTGQLNIPVRWTLGLPLGTESVKSLGFHYQWGLALIDGFYKDIIAAPLGFFWEYNQEILPDEHPNAIGKDAVGYEHLEYWNLIAHNKGKDGIELELRADKPLHYILYKNQKFDYVANKHLEGTGHILDFVERGVLQPGKTKWPHIMFNGNYEIVPLTPTMVDESWGDPDTLVQSYNHTNYHPRVWFSEIPEKTKAAAEKLATEFIKNKK